MDGNIDQGRLSELREVMEEGYQQLLETFLEDSAQRIGQLRGISDCDELAEFAHSFKGSSSNMGAVSLAEACRLLEERARDHAVDDIGQLKDRIDREYAEVQRFYADERQRVSTL